jgi:hypothetical protein
MPTFSRKIAGSAEAVYRLLKLIALFAKTDFCCISINRPQIGNL